MVILWILLAIFLFLILVLVGYYIYLATSYYRIEDDLKIKIEENAMQCINLGEKYSILTTNIGFGAYSDSYTFFMDRGVMENGKINHGRYSKARSKLECLENVNGSIALVKSYNPDFVFFQEVDTDSTRSYHINQAQMIKKEFRKYSASFGVNFHSAFLAYPLYSFHGKSNSGLLTLANKKIDEAIRKSLPIDEGMFSRFFDLDRAIVINYLPISNGKKLVLINCHLSAYDKGGKYRELQTKLLSSLLENLYKDGNYVIAGGDFNQDISDSIDYFPTKEKVPYWVKKFKKEYLSNNFYFADAKNNAPTCRGANIPYEKGISYLTVIDGFILSKNIEVIKVFNVENEFKYSDHNPVYLEFILK